MSERTCDHPLATPGLPGRCSDCGTSLAAEQHEEILRATAAFLTMVAVVERQVAPAIEELNRAAESLRQALIEVGFLDQDDFVLVPGRAT